MFGISDDAAITREPTLDEINAKIPRGVHVAPNAYGELGFMLLSLGGALIWFTILAFFTVQDLQHRKALATEGRTTNATVIRVLDGRSIYIVYRFQLAEQPYQGEVKVPEKRRTPAVGTELPILFLPSDPAVSHPIGWAWWTWWDIVPHLYISMFLIGGFVLAGNFYRERWLASRGWVTEGTVTGCAQNKTRFMVYYEFRTDRNELIEGLSKYCEDEYKAGSKIKVIYVRNHPKRNTVYPMSTYHD